MDEFLSTRQVIDILKVDRITIYRMLQDGRLKGIKIGQQWRFSRSEVDRLLGAPHDIPVPVPPDSAIAFPVHCVQTIQDLFSEISQISALMLDPQGVPLTEMPHPCRLCQLAQQSPSGREACAASWQAAALHPENGVHRQTCHAGLEYICAPVIDGGSYIGMFLAGQAQSNSTKLVMEIEQMQQFAEIHNIPLSDLEMAVHDVPRLSQQQQEQVIVWVSSVVKAVQSILNERTTFISRLQQIATLTQLS